MVVYLQIFTKKLNEVAVAIAAQVPGSWAVYAAIQRPATPSTASDPKPTTPARDTHAHRVGRSASWGRASQESLCGRVGVAVFTRRQAGTARKTLGDGLMDSERRATLITQRLQRARLSRGLSGSEMDDNDEIGCQIIPV